VPSEYVPVAVNCVVDPAKAVPLDGLMDRLASCRRAASTLRVVKPEIEPEEAVMVACPAENACASPSLIVAVEV